MHFYVCEFGGTKPYLTAVGRSFHPLWKGLTWPCELIRIWKVFSVTITCKRRSAPTPQNFPLKKKAVSLSFKERILSCGLRKIDWPVKPRASIHWCEVSLYIGVKVELSGDITIDGSGYIRNYAISELIDGLSEHGLMDWAIERFRMTARWERCYWAIEELIEWWIYWGKNQN